ncbi:MAG: T9SS type A sorting domain-containing protein [Bacteroidetes bacterium]|nr:T9SS type A sorting domain-containing protein [Bacteroidota bacterium]
MKKIFTYLLGLTMLLIANANSAQNRSGNWCFTDEQTQLLQQQNPALIQQQQDLEDYILNFSQSFDPTAKKATIIIPIVFHVITDNGNGNVTKAEIQQAVNVINQDFKRLNPDAANTRSIFQPYVASLDIEFRLAHLDPNGNCTEGIVRVESPLSSNATDAVKAVSYWNSKKYFNVWVVDLINGSAPPSYVAGYAQFPSSGINSTYGVVIDNTFLSGRTLTHEIGHCFNLYHTFQSGCGSTNCSASGDMCCDTPPVSTSSGSCDYSENTCSNDVNHAPYNANVLDQIENYMSYNACQNMFSLNQATRMMSTLNSANTTTGLAQLWTPSNLAFTGTGDPYDPNPICIPWGADFSYNKQYLCEGEAVTYSDLNTYNATPTLWDWTFTGGTPNTSNVASPVITYNTAGTYGATYSPGTTAGYYTPAVSKSNIITVSSIAAQFTLPFIEGMENTTNFNNDWTINTISGNGWQNVTTASYSGTRSLKINNLANSINDVSEAISSSLNLTSLQNPIMTFKLAYAKKVSGGNDQLIIYSSIDCGASWQIVTIKSASTMSSAPATDVAFTPSGTTQWKNHSITISAGLAAQTNVRFKFYFKSNGGNNVYLDDINVDGTVGIDEPKLVNNLTIFPNPTSESAALSFNLISEVKNLSVTLKDVLGKEVTKIINGQPFAAGRYTLSIDQGKKLASGLYFIEFNADNKISVEKLIVR